MKGSDKMLWLIVGAVVVLVVAAFVLVLLRPEQDYVADDDPQGVVHNYLLALRRGDYEKAYSYLAPDLQIDDLEEFIDSVEDRRWAFQMGSNVALSIEDSRLSKDDSARVTVRKQVTNNELLGSGQRSDDFSVFLRSENGLWRIYRSQDYWNSCWDEDSNCQ